MEHNLTLLGDRVWIKLDEAVSHTETDSGIIIPLNELTETDGGRITTRPSNRKYFSSGTVVALSDKSSEMLSHSIKVGDRVYVNDRVVNKDYQFFPDRTKLVQEFKGDILISANYIEVKIND